MVAASPRNLVGVSWRRAALFIPVVGGLFVAGRVVDRASSGPNPHRVLPFVLGLLLLLTAITTVQAYYNGSTLLGLLLSLALPLGVLAPTLSVPIRGFGLFLLRLGATIGLLFGSLGHALGVELVTERDTPVEPSRGGQVGLLLLALGLAGWHVAVA